MKTECYSYFFIESNGQIEDGIGLVGNKKGIFDPAEITKRLGIIPFRIHKFGEQRKNDTKYLFSSWSGLKTNIGRIDIVQQCNEIVDTLRSKIDILKSIKIEYDVCFGIMIVPHIVVNEPPMMSFNENIIWFCNEIGATIEVNMYTYPELDEQ